MKRLSTARAVFAAGVSAIGLLSQPVLAQDEQTDNNDSKAGTTEIIVTAQFREQRLQDTPLAITAVTADELEAKSQTDLATVADQAPNVQIRPATAAYGPSVTASIRGIGQNDFNPAYEPGVGIYIDDIYYPSLTGASVRHAGPRPRRDPARSPGHAVGPQLDRRRGEDVLEDAERLEQRVRRGQLRFARPDLPARRGRLLPDRQYLRPHFRRCEAPGRLREAAGLRLRLPRRRFRDVRRQPRHHPAGQPGWRRSALHLEARLSRRQAGIDQLPGRPRDRPVRADQHFRLHDHRRLHRRRTHQRGPGPGRHPAHGEPERPFARRPAGRRSFHLRPIL